MSTVAEIEKAIQKLTPQEIEAVAEWLREFREEMWDQQIAADAKAGKLDFLVKEAKAARKNKTLRDWPGKNL